MRMQGAHVGAADDESDQDEIDDSVALLCDEENLFSYLNCTVDDVTDTEQLFEALSLNFLWDAGISLEQVCICLMPACLCISLEQVCVATKRASCAGALCVELQGYIIEYTLGATGDHNTFASLSSRCASA